MSGNFDTDKNRKRDPNKVPVWINILMWIALILLFLNFFSARGHCATLSIGHYAKREKVPHTEARELLLDGSMRSAYLIKKNRH